MFQAIVGLAILLIAAVAVGVGRTRRWQDVPDDDPYRWMRNPWTSYAVAGVAGVLGIVVVASTSFTVIGADEVGHLKRVYGGSAMPPGQIIAMKGQAGPQAEVLSPGFNFRPLLNVLYEVEKLPIVDIPADSYAFVVARDGAPLDPGQVLADAWPEQHFTRMLDAAYFLRNGGQKGPQLSVLTPGRYRINRYLFDISTRPATNIEIGTVGVVKSNAQEIEDCYPIPRPEDEVLAVPLVPKGCIGVWNEPLRP